MFYAMAEWDYVIAHFISASAGATGRAVRCCPRGTELIFYVRFGLLLRSTTTLSVEEEGAIMLPPYTGTRSPFRCNGRSVMDAIKLILECGINLASFLTLAAICAADVCKSRNE